MGFIKIILASLLLSFNFQSFSIPIKCTIKGEIIDRDSRILLLYKPTDNLHAENSKIRVKIINNHFEYTFTAAQEEMYQLIFEDELEKGSWTAIHFFPAAGTVTFVLHPMNDWLKNKVHGGKLNEEYYTFLQNYWGLFLPQFNILNEERDKLQKKNEYYTVGWEKLREELKAAKDMEAKQAVRETMEKSRNIGTDLTEKGMAHKNRVDSVLSDQVEWRYNYIREHISLPSYFLLLMDLSQGKTNRHIANNITELYPRFAAAFRDHVYTPRIADELTGLMRIRPGERYIDINIPDLKGQIHALSKNMEGKITLVDFWGSWCGPCIVKTRKMAPLYKTYKDKGFTIVGIAREYKNTREVEKRLALEKWEWQQLIEMDDKYGVWNKYGISNGTGMLVLIDKEGKILAVDPTPEEVESYLKRLL